MKILVTAKRVEDPESKIKVTADGVGIATEGVKYVMNPFDAIGVEEGLRLVAKHKGELVVATIGPQKAMEEQMRHALAMGADRGIWVEHTGPLDQLAIAHLFKKIVEAEKPDLVLLGKQAIDDDQNQVGQMLAELLGWPQATFASKLEPVESKEPGLKVSADGKSVTVIREVDGGIATVECQLPAIVTTDLRLNEPRYASLPGIMKAKSKPFKKTNPAELGVDVKPRIQVVKLSHPPARKAGIKVPDVATLMDKLKNEAKVI
jgi:electron transfer flavoprotein beta subunit